MIEMFPVILLTVSAKGSLIKQKITIIGKKLSL